MGDILKEAIADAKAVRETALANAKMALEEAFTPQLKSMLAAKLREDDEDYEDEEGGEDEDFGGDEEPAEEDFGGDDEDGGEEDFGDDEAPEEGYDEDHEGGDEDFEDEESVEDDEDFEDEVAETIEVNGKTYSLVSEDDDEEMDYEDDEEVEEDISNLDLEAIIRELEDEISEEEEFDEDAVEESDEFDDEEVNEDDEFEIDETLFEEDGDDEEDAEEDNSDEIEEIKSELGEYKEAVVFLKDKLHEVNILNAKLLFTNKLFKEFNLDNNQKLKVVETFDRAQSTREIKLVYSTLAEQFSDNGSITRKHSIKESASTKSGSTKPKRKIITEENQVADRFRKLAGLL